MAGHYSTRSFFRQIPNDLLARYFQRRGLLGDFGFGSVGKPPPEALFAAWLELPDDDRNAMEAEFGRSSRWAARRESWPLSTKRAGSGGAIPTG